MKSPVPQVFLSLCLISASATCLTAANWTADFDSPLPASWTTIGITQPPGTSATFSATIDSGVLRLSDSTPAKDGGSFSAFGGTTDDVFSDVKVGAVVNVAKDSNDDLGVVARSDPNAGNGYFGNVDLERGNVCIAKVAGFSSGVDLACSADGALSGSASYYIELSATGAATTDLKLDVYDMAGGTLLQTVGAADDGTIPNFGASYLAGISGVFMVPKGTTLNEALSEPLNGTFDDVSSTSVPEPAAGSLLLMAILGMAQLRRRTGM